MKFVHFIQLILVLGILMAVGLPLFRGLAKTKLFSKVDRAEEEFKHLLVRKEEILLSIKDLEFELQTDKVSREDYQALRNKLEMEGAAILERIDELEKAKKEKKKSSKHVTVG